ncbi:hypothetical protein LZC95_26925 [Pendulispora brunnea]|uniref:Uncharacterized protein n=1 Tax=Pendulispora brunnea TaxID=2905690 RepID=A0ABZ2K143_9BACT
MNIARIDDAMRSVAGFLDTVVSYQEYMIYQRREEEQANRALYGQYEELLSEEYR